MGTAEQNRPSSTDNVTTIEGKNEGMRGSITMDESVVATIAGLAASEIQGIHSLGKPRLVSFGANPRRGVEAEVGQKQAALDLDVVIDYGCDIKSVADELRQQISERVLKMAGREVVEVNVHVVDISLPESKSSKAEETPPRRVI